MRHPIIDQLLDSYRNTIGEHFEKYRNHVYRVFANCLLLDRDTRYEDKYAVAAVFHDLGIWTDRTIDHLGPSRKLAESWLIGTDRADWIGSMK